MLQMTQKSFWFFFVGDETPLTVPSPVDKCQTFFLKASLKFKDFEKSGLSIKDKVIL